MKENKQDPLEDETTQADPGEGTDVDQRHRVMNRGIEILIMWLVVAFCVSFVVPCSIPQNGLKSWTDFLTVISFPFAAWVYAGHSARVSPVICFGLLAGALSILPFLGDPNGMARDHLTKWKCILGGAPVLMTLICVGMFALRRFMDREVEPCVPENLSKETDKKL